MAEKERTAWKKINVDGGYGFAEIDYVGDVAQIYADGELVADEVTGHGKTWRVPCKNCFYGKKMLYGNIGNEKTIFIRNFNRRDKNGNDNYVESTVPVRNELKQNTTIPGVTGVITATCTG